MKPKPRWRPCHICGATATIRVQTVRGERSHKVRLVRGGGRWCERCALVEQARRQARIEELDDRLAAFRENGRIYLYVSTEPVESWTYNALCNRMQTKYDRDTVRDAHIRVHRDRGHLWVELYPPIVVDGPEPWAPEAELYQLRLWARLPLVFRRVSLAEKIDPRWPKWRRELIAPDDDVVPVVEGPDPIKWSALRRRRYAMNKYTKAKRRRKKQLAAEARARRKAALAATESSHDHERRCPPGDASLPEIAAGHGLDAGVDRPEVFMPAVAGSKAD